jgi:glycosyltransferase involved in cell wall biosynthesis
VSDAPTRASANGRTAVRQLRVAQVCANFSAGSGGVALRGALALDRDRFSNTILTPETGGLVDRAEAAGLEVIRLSHMGTARRIDPWADARAKRELTSYLEAGEFDLVHTHGARSGGVGRLAARRAGVPAVVHTFHGFPFHEFQSPVTRGVLCTIERRLARITDYFLTAGALVASEAIRLNIAPPDRIRPLISPIDDGIPQVSSATRERARRLLGIPDEAKVVGTAARLALQKAPVDMVTAIAALRRPDVYMVWLGDGELRAKTERAIEKHGLRDRFLLLGDRDDVFDLLPGFDVFAMSSLFEGLPCSIVEAMTCGVPVVSTAVNSVPEIVISSKTGLLARPRDPDSLSRALAYMLDHPDEAARMAATARAQIGEQFRPDLLGRELTEAYEAAFRFAGVTAAGVGRG